MRGPRVDLPEYSQVLCTVLQIALVDLLRSLGVHPVAVVGHSSGEIAAAYTVGALSHQSACRVAYWRGIVVGNMGRADSAESMMVVGLMPSSIPDCLRRADLLDRNTIHIACINSPTNVTLSGDSEDMESLRTLLDSDGISARVIKTGVAYHSPVMHKISNEYLIHLVNCLYPATQQDCMDASAPALASSVTGGLLDPGVMTTAEYWIKNLVSPVIFHQAVEKLVTTMESSDQNVTLIDFVEVGPRCALQKPVRETVGPSIRYHAVLDHRRLATHTILDLIGHLFCQGHPVSITAANGHDTTDRHPFLVDCPPYSFDHSRRYWTESRLSKDFRFRPYSAGYLLGKRAHDFNVLRPRWRNWLSREVLPWLGDHVVSPHPLLCSSSARRSRIMQCININIGHRQCCLSWLRYAGHGCRSC